MLLIGICGVADIGQRSFKSFPVDFAWTSNEQKNTYQWFLEMLKKQVDDELHQTVFVTDKCTALRNALNKLFRQNKKLLCAWHMRKNLSDLFNKKTFKDDGIFEKKQLLYFCFD
ncbi:hypothetical protein A0J61_10063 [Choanephora cucurbitarum]|uniref:MULE transposase domain-containing protein n=1 Tax=Choanephora cucurbitarum TaxID=101091 RepID=A0A1C7MYP4_9FUNG|nr:hypothetical protein A0J61_10063 [Choanephora cucurbitarum]